MWIDAERFYNFYQTPLGQCVAYVINQVIAQLWSPAGNDILAGVGFAHPFMNQFRGMTARTIIAMLRTQGAIAWPSNNNNATILMDEISWPFKDETIDKLLVVHSFEFCESRDEFLFEAWRTLKPQGELIVIIADKQSMWARSPHSPFGYGQSYLTYQIELLLHNYGFITAERAKALITPPLNQHFIVKSMYNIEKINKLCLNNIGGIMIFKAVKQVYGLHPPLKKTWLPKIFKPVNLSYKS